VSPETAGHDIPVALAHGILFRDERGAVRPSTPRPSGPPLANSTTPPIFAFDDRAEDEADDDPARLTDARAHRPRVWRYASVGVLGAATATLAVALWLSPPRPARATARDTTGRVTREGVRLSGPLLREDPAPVVQPPAPRSVEHIIPRASRAATSGAVSVNAQPWGQVYIDDRFVGTTPMIGVTVAAGRHRVRVTHDGFAPATRTVLVPAGGRVRITDIILQALDP